MQRNRFMMTVFLLLSCAISPTLAQQPEQRESFSDEIEVDVVNIEVHVTRRGFPVRGLKPDDFEVLEDGQPVEITNFCAIENGAIVLEASGGQLLEQRRVEQPQPEPVPESRMDMVVYVDLLFSRTEALRRTLPEIRKFFDKHLRDGDRVMVVVFNGLIEVVTPFTGDRSTLSDALESIRKRAALGDLFDAESLQIIKYQQNLQNAAQSEINQLSEGEIKEMVTGEVRSGSERGRLLITRALRALHSMVALLSSGVPGRKSILLVGDGIPIDVNQGVAQAMYPDDLLLTGTMRNSPLNSGNVVDAANASGITIHTISSSGLSEGKDTGVIGPEVSGWLAQGRTDGMRLQRFTDTASSMATVSRISESTGGLTIFKANPKTLKAIANDLDSLYSIGIRPARPDATGNRRIKVIVRRKGLLVRHRYGYQPLAEMDRLAAGTIAALAIDPQTNPLDLRCEVGAQARQDENGLHLPLSLKIPVQRLALIPDGDAWNGRLTMLLIGRKGQDGLSPMRQLTFPMSLSEDPYAEGTNKVISFSAEIALRPGSSTVAVTAYDDVAKVASTITTEVQLDRSGQIKRD